MNVLMTQAVYTSETLVYFNKTTWHCITAGSHIHFMLSNRH
jgi:hypothetical protein